MEPLSTEVLQQQGFIHSPAELKGKLGQRFQFLSKLGEGSFGMVAAAIDRQTGKQVAIKKIKMNKKSEGMPASSLREIAILKNVKHHNIVKIDEVFYDQELMQLAFLLEYHPTNLYEYIKEKNPLTIQQIKLFSFQMLSSLQYLHQKGIIHRDLKPQNFLLSSDGDLRLCDFGQAKVTFYKPQKHTADISTLWYRAPQILMGASLYDEKVDIWAAGCVIIEMILGKPFFQASNEISLLFAIFKVFGTPKIEDYPEMEKMKDFSPSYPKFPGLGLNIDSLSHEANDFLTKILVVNPGHRMSAEQALRHDFFIGVSEVNEKKKDNS